MSMARDGGLRDVAHAVASIERTLFETLGSAETGNALRALLDVPDALRDIQYELHDVTEALREVRDAIRGGREGELSEQTSFFGKGSPALTSCRSDWETPRDLFVRLDRFWHFDLDAAVSDDNHLCDEYYTVETDGLAHSWAGRRVWCNPPYGKDIARWVEKAYRETRDGETCVVMLVPARTDTRWYHDFVQDGAAEVRFIRGRLKYTLGGGRAELGALPVDARALRRRATVR